MIHENLSELDGAPVKDYDPGVGLEDPSGTAYRVRLDYDDYFEKNVRIESLLQKLLEDPRVSELARLVIGAWDFESSESSAAIVERLASGGETLRRLAALFFGDIVGEEQEISWIQQSDVTPLLTSLPGLTSLTIRGAEGLALSAVRNGTLESLVIQTGGLPPAVIEGVVESDFPRLKHLELWLGDGGYGYQTGSIDLLAPLLAGHRFPRLESLGLRNCEEQDLVAKLVANAPIVDRLEVLDLSLGNLSDEGAEALLGSAKLENLRRLDLHHHYMTNEVASRLASLGIDVDVADPQTPDSYDGKEYRYVAVSE